MALYIYVTLQVPMDEAAGCNDLISNSECTKDNSKCVCLRGLVQYAGGVCQVALTGVYSIFYTYCFYQMVELNKINFPSYIHSTYKIVLQKCRIYYKIKSLGFLIMSYVQGFGILNTSCQNITITIFLLDLLIYTLFITHTTKITTLN